MMKMMINRFTNALSILILSIEVQMKKIPLKLYKEFVEENGLEQKLEKWAKKREKSSNAKPKIELGKLVEQISRRVRLTGLET